MRELGDASRDEHDGARPARRRASASSQLVVVGEAARPMLDGAALRRLLDEESAHVRDDADAAVALLRGALRPGDVVLVKASRAAASKGWPPPWWPATLTRATGTERWRDEGDPARGRDSV